MAAFMTKRLLNLYVFLFCCAMMGIAYYMQYSMHLEPCPLCIMQRVFFTAAEDFTESQPQRQLAVKAGLQGVVPFADIHIDGPYLHTMIARIAHKP